jgi:hypothetical protein
MLELKIFGHPSIVFALPYYFVKLEMAHAMQKQSFKLMKV